MADTERAMLVALYEGLLKDQHPDTQARHAASFSVVCGGVTPLLFVEGDTFTTVLPVTEYMEQNGYRCLAELANADNVGLLVTTRRSEAVPGIEIHSIAFEDQAHVRLLPLHSSLMTRLAVQALKRQPSDMFARFPDSFVDLEEDLMQLMLYSSDYDSDS